MAVSNFATARSPSQSVCRCDRALPRTQDLVNHYGTNTPTMRSSTPCRLYDHSLSPQCRRVKCERWPHTPTDTSPRPVVRSPDTGSEQCPCDPNSTRGRELVSGIVQP